MECELKVGENQSFLGLNKDRYQAGKKGENFRKLDGGGMFSLVGYSRSEGIKVLKDQKKV